MSPELVLSTTVLVAGALLAVTISGRLRRLLERWPFLASLPLLTAILLTAYVFGEDSYRGNGISRWNAYRSPGGALGPMFVLSVALMTACAALLLYAAFGKRDRLLRVTAFAGALASVALVIPTVLGFTLN